MVKRPAAKDTTDKRDMFSQVRVLVADSDVRTAELVRRLLYSFGFRRIYMADNTPDALMQVRAKQVELLITESRIHQGSGAGLVRSIRRAAAEVGIRRDLPIIMLTAEAEMDDVIRARDSGITEFVVKPFSAKTLSHRIIQVIDSPRVFVESPGYSGPCRRRREAPPGGVERRTPPESKPIEHTSNIGMFSGLGGMIHLAQEKEASIYAPNMGLKSLIGNVNAQDILNDDVVNEAQRELQQAENEYLVWAQEDIAKLEAAYEELCSRPSDPTAHYLLMSAAYSIKAQAGIFGYELGTRIGKMLVEYLQHNPAVDGGRILVIRKHIDAIQVIFNQKIKSSGQQLGEELILSLKTLITKMG